MNVLYKIVILFIFQSVAFAQGSGHSGNLYKNGKQNDSYIFLFGGNEALKENINDLTVYVSEDLNVNGLISNEFKHIVSSLIKTIDELNKSYQSTKEISDAKKEIMKKIIFVFKKQLNFYKSQYNKSTKIGQGFIITDVFSESISLYTQLMIKVIEVNTNEELTEIEEDLILETITFSSKKFPTVSSLDYGHVNATLNLPDYLDYLSRSIEIIQELYKGNQETWMLKVIQTKSNNETTLDGITILIKNLRDKISTKDSNIINQLKKLNSKIIKLN